MIEHYRNALQYQLELARTERDEDNAYWTELATGQDSEEAERSGYLDGFADGLGLALTLLNRNA